MNEYTASNGIEVRLLGRDLDIKNTLDWIGICGGVVVDAVREFFRAEEDERLGRWRWPALPEYVAYWHPALQMLTVTWEPEGGSTFFKRDDDLTYAGNPGKVARAYFDAHPEPKPAWHDAQEGEVWLITYDGNEYPAIFQAEAFRDLGGSWNADVITDARRIWPES